MDANRSLLFGALALQTGLIDSDQFTQAGRLWLARDRFLDREVALKELLPERAAFAKLAARFVREARLTGRLEHPGIVPVYELTARTGTDEPCYTMRFVRGDTLSDVVHAYHAKRARGVADPLDFVELL